MSEPLVLDEREFLTTLTWGAGSSLTAIEAESKLAKIHYRQISGLDDLTFFLQQYSDLTQDARQKYKLSQTIEEINSLPKEKQVILDKLVRYSWMPDPAFYSNVPQKGAEGFSFIASDGPAIRVLSFRGYSSDEIDFFDNKTVPSAFILLHEARHLYAELPNGNSKIFATVKDPDNAIQDKIDDAYSS